MGQTKRGEVYYADLSPSIGSEQGGCRPVVILQNDTGNRYSSTVIIAPVTSQRKPKMKTHIKVCGMDALDESTIILLEQVRTIDKIRIERFLCKLSEETMKKVDKALKISLGLKEERGGEELGEIVKINNRDILMKEYMGQRVATFKDIDDVHERPDGTANKRFIDNKKRFVEGEDYFVVSNSEIRKSRMFPISDSDFMDKTLITESGYYMLVKSFTDDLAWKVQRELTKSYFNGKKLMSPEEMMRIQLGMIDELGGKD